MPPSETLLLLALQQVLDQQTLSREAARNLLDSILEDQDSEQSNPNREPRLAALLGALAARGETEDELAGFVDSLRSHISSIALTSEERSTLVDTCGTGGDLSGTFNISTAAALVAAAAGATVAKHGNRAVSSRSGSADVLEAVGIPVELTPAQAAAALRTHRFAFLSAPSLQPAMRAVMPLRRALGVRTAFNILGPMTNPAGARAQVLGVYAAHLVPRVAHTLARLDTRHAFVVHGSAHLTEGQEHLPRRGGLDEFSISGPSTVAEVSGDQVRFFTVLPEDFGLPLASIGSLAGGDASANAAILRGIFSGEPGPRRDVVLMNASAVLVTAGLARNFLDGARLAAATIDSGGVLKLIAALAQSSVPSGDFPAGY